MSDPMTVVAYCGLPPSPAGIWTHWRLDPIVLSVLFAWLASYVAGACALRGTARRLKAREIAFFCSGWAIATLALVSPLCPLSVALFSARATQHVILTLLARIELVNSGHLAKGRRYAIVIILALAALLTPPDPISQIGLSLPMYALYELSIFSVKLVERQRAKKLAEEAAAQG